MKLLFLFDNPFVIQLQFTKNKEFIFDDILRSVVLFCLFILFSFVDYAVPPAPTVDLLFNW